MNLIKKLKKLFKKQSERSEVCPAGKIVYKKTLWCKEYFEDAYVFVLSLE